MSRKALRSVLVKELNEGAATGTKYFTTVSAMERAIKEGDNPVKEVK